VHTFLAFFAWPDGGVWGNVVAMPLCAVLGAIAAYVLRDRIGRALSDFWRRHFGHQAELEDIRERLEAHADLLDVHTPGGMAAVLDEVRRAVAASEAAHEAVKALGVIRQAPRRGQTEMRPAAGQKPPQPGGMGSRVPPKTPGSKM
jgi:hypothetical protein